MIHCIATEKMHFASFECLGVGNKKKGGDFVSQLFLLKIKAFCSEARKRADCSNILTTCPPVASSEV
jgi:hypothetical protein